jgi:hypothetical protein
VSEALDLAALVDRRMLSGIEVRVEHADAGRFDNLLREWAPGRTVVLDEPVYAGRAVFTLWVPADAVHALEEEVAAASGGVIAAEPTGAQRLLDVPRA